MYYKHINDWVKNPTKENAIALGNFYFDSEQWASALVYYLRATEFEEDIDTYWCLLRVAMCLNNQGGRYTYSKAVVLHAINLYPMRKEAYHLMSKIYEWTKEYPESYSYATLGLTQREHDGLEGVDYFGNDGLLFQKGVAGWWMGREDESLEIFYDLYKKKSLPNSHIEAIKNNIKMILS